MQRIIDSKYFMLVLGFIGLFLVSTGVSLAAFTFLVDGKVSAPNNTVSNSKISRVDLSKPKTQTIPDTYSHNINDSPN